MFQILRDYINLYGDLKTFLVHKCTHFIYGILAAMFVVHLGQKSLISYCYAISFVFGCAIGKEIADRYKSYDATAPKGEEYRYDAPMWAHAFDVIITVLGGVNGCLIMYL